MKYQCKISHINSIYGKGVPINGTKFHKSLWVSILYHFKCHRSIDAVDGEINCGFASEHRDITVFLYQWTRYVALCIEYLCGEERI